MPRIRHNPIDKDWLLKRYLFELDLTGDKGTPYPDEVWEQASEAAVEWAETELDILVVDRQRDIVERQDFEAQAWYQWQAIALDKSPIRRVTKLEYVFGGTTPSKVTEIPIGWVYVADDESGQIRVIPNAGTMGAAFAQLFGGTAVWFGLVTSGNASHIPGFFQITYRAGFYPGYRSKALPVAGLDHVPTGEIYGYVSVLLDQVSGQAATKFLLEGTNLDTGAADTEEVVIGASAKKALSEKRWSSLTKVTLSTPGTATTWTVDCEHDVPKDIMHCMGMYASMLLLNPAGDMVAGAGIASKSIGIDGLSQSISTTASATNAGYGSRIIQYWKDIDRLMPNLRRRYRAGSMIEVA